MHPPIFRTRITELFGIRHPILAGGLMWLSDARYVAAVVRAGGMAFLTPRSFPEPGAFARELEEGRVSPKSDLAFHASIAEACGNDFFPAVLETIHESINGFMRLSLNLTRTGSRQRAARVVDEHAAILAAIREQDGEQARIAMQFHLNQARHRLVDRDRD